MSLEYSPDQLCYASEAEWSDFDHKDPLDDAPEQLALGAGIDLPNCDLPAIAPIEPNFEKLLEEVDKALEKEDAYENIAKFAREMHDVVADQEPDWVEVARRRYGTPAHAAATMALMLLVAPTPQPDLLFEEGADHVSLLLEANEELCNRFLKTWGETWRDQHFSRPFDFSSWVTLGKAYLGSNRSCGMEVGKLTSKALCAAAPAKEHQKKRKQWYQALFKAFHPHLKDIFPNAFLAQVALDEGLVHELSKPSMEQVISIRLTANEELPNNSVDSLWKKDIRILTAFLNCIRTHLRNSNSARTILPDGFWTLTQSILGHALVKTTRSSWTQTALVKLLTENLWLAGVNLELNYSKELEEEKQKTNRLRSSRFFNIFRKLFARHTDVVEPQLYKICQQLHPDMPGKIIEELRKKPPP